MITMDILDKNFFPNLTARAQLKLDYIAIAAGFYLVGYIVILLTYGWSDTKT